MKRIISICAAVALLGALGAPAAFAGVTDSRHDMASTGIDVAYSGNLANLNLYGTCSACHLPHGAGAERLFPSTAGGGGDFFSPLCGSCHDPSTNGNNVDANFNITVMDPNAHQFSLTNLAGHGSHDGVAGGQAGLAGLKYLSSGESPRSPQVAAIECLSCHDVHNQQTERPFMQVALDDLCELCHLGRVNDDTANVGWTNTGLNGSTHPAGPNFEGDVSGIATATNSPFDATNIDTYLTAAQDSAGDGSTWTDTAWDSGAKLGGPIVAGKPATGFPATNYGVDCNTCHTVHWNEAVGDNNSDYLGFVDDTNGGDSNAFCEACHRGAQAVPVEMQGGIDSNPATSVYYWNPGGSSYSHPNDDIGAQATIPSNMPIGQTTTSARTGTGSSGMVCTSCHGVHPADATGPETEQDTPILLNYDEGTYADVCDACHSTGAGTFTFASGSEHHPTGASVYATNGNAAGGVSCAGGDLGPGINQCHGQGGGTSNGGWAAHNRTAALGSPGTSNSGSCEACHTDNPSVYTPSNTYSANGISSHFVGDAEGSFGTNRTTEVTAGAIRYAGDGTSATGTTLWSVGGSGATLPSLFGATIGDIICESCHRLADGNIASGNGATNLLLEVSGHAAATVSNIGTSQEVLTNYTDQEYLCTGCHLVPSGTHPLNQADGSSFVIATTTYGQEYTTGFSTGNVNCESCHSPHDADTPSGSYILDFGATSSDTTGMAVEPADLVYTGFCAVCHGTYE